MNETLQISEIYSSIQGEAAKAGFPCVMVRLTGCPLRCRWCDTTHAFAGGELMSFGQIRAKIAGFGIKLVEFTGGEPLAQENTPRLIDSLINDGYEVMIETGGSEAIERLPAKTHVIMDIKCPGSKMAERNRWENVTHLKPTDEVKFVVADRSDFDWAVQQIQEFHLMERCQVLFSPAFGLVTPQDLVSWMLESGLSRTKLNMQLHKYIWHPRAKGV